MGRSKSQVVGYRYFFGIHMGIGRGPIDELHEVKVGGRTAWRGRVGNNQTINIDAYNLFGGEEKEGGVQGPLEVMMGEPDQVASPGLTAMLPAPLSGFRRMFTVFYDGLVSMNNPYPKPWAFRFSRILKGWDGPVFEPGLAAIVIGQVNYNTELLGVPFTEAAQPTSGLFSVGYTSPENPGYYAGSTFRITNFGIEPLETLSVDGNEDLTEYPKASIIERGVDITDYTIGDSVFDPGQPTAAYASLMLVAFNPVNPALGLPPAIASYLRFGRYEGVRQWALQTVIGSISDTQVLLGTLPPAFRFKARIDTRRRVIEHFVNDVFVTSVAFPPNAGTVQNINSFLGRGLFSVDGNPYSIGFRNYLLQSTDLEFPSGMNPAHIIYECLTNREWGRGLSRTKIDEESFRQAARTLYSEGFGLCLKWTRKDSIQSFVQLVLDHIGATLYQHRVTALMTLKLIRDDYDETTMPVINDESGLLAIDEVTVANRGKSVNMIAVKWHDPINDQDRIVSVKNTAAVISNSGAINSATKDYIGVPYAELALRLAQRDLRASSINLRRFSLTLDQRGDVVHPGDVLVIEDPKRGVSSIAVRVGKVRDGTLTDGKVRIEVIQDVFSLPSVSFSASVPVQYTPPSTVPCVDQVHAIEAPYFILASRLRPADLSFVAEDGGYMLAMASKGKPINAGVEYAIRDGAPTPDDNPPDESFVCEV